MAGTVDLRQSASTACCSVLGMSVSTPLDALFPWPVMLWLGPVSHHSLQALLICFSAPLCLLVSKPVHLRIRPSSTEASVICCFECQPLRPAMPANVLSRVKSVSKAVRTLARKREIDSLRGNPCERLNAPPEELRLHLSERVPKRETETLNRPLNSINSMPRTP